MAEWRKYADPPPSASLSPARPQMCPACGGTSIRTTAKQPDADSYWRCDGCGEVWNAARREITRPRSRPRY